jgi:hypothetical protein
LGATLNEVNGMQVRTLAEFREAVQKSEKTGFFTLRASDNVTRKSENLLVVLPWKKVVEEEPKLARDFRYPMTQLAQNIVQSHMAANKKEQSVTLPGQPNLLVASA